MSQESPHGSRLEGQILEGVYRIDNLLGEGGMGAVYGATHLRLNKRVAIKIMAQVLTSHPESLARFHREAQVTSGLGHPHIVQVFDFSTTPSGEPFLVMEFLQGEDLDRRLARTGRLPLSKVLHIVKQIASALSATHAQGIVHRDLKPANIYLVDATGEDDFVKVLDFGISKVQTATSKLTKTASVLGTPRYMSPEQAEGRGDDVDERTDQWALACIAWECLTGLSPFDADNAHAVLFKIVGKNPPAMASFAIDANPRVEAVLLRALAKRKQDRFASIGEFAAAMTAAAEGAVVEAPATPKTVQLSADAPDAVASSAIEALPPVPERVTEAAAGHSLFRARWAWVTLLNLAGLLFLIVYLLVRSPPTRAPADTRAREALQGRASPDVRPKAQADLPPLPSLLARPAEDASPPSPDTRSRAEPSIAKSAQGESKPRPRAHRWDDEPAWDPKKTKRRPAERWHW